MPDPDDEAVVAALGDGDWQARLRTEIAQRSLELDLHQPRTERPERRRLPQPPEAIAALRCGPVPLRHLDTDWGRSSYTAWTRASHGTPVSLAALDEGRDTSDPSSADEAPEAGADLWPEQGPLAGFARGAAAGDCLHRMLEQLDYRRPTDAAANRELVERELRRAGLEAETLEPLLQGLELVRLTPFGGELGSLRVADLGPERRLNEMNFDLTLGFARAAGLAAAFAEHPGGAFGAAYAASVGALPVASRGFLTGSIDLLFTATGADGEERWWVADWKSNWLGRRDGEGRPLACGPRHYGQEAMAALMAASHYPLQAHLYLVALHRYLGWRLPGYAPERHLGGYAYVFLRGTPGEAGVQALPGAVPGIFVERPPLARVLALDGALGGHAAAGPGEVAP
jgi:exodeoxyribonuclease V beta subunit